MLDEIRVDADGEIDVRLVRTGSVGTEPYVAVTLKPGTQVWELVRRGHLVAIARDLGLACPIVYVVHGGGDQYTIGDEAGRTYEANEASHPRTLRILRRLAREVEAVESARANHTTVGPFLGMPGFVRPRGNRGASGAIRYEMSFARSTTGPPLSPRNPVPPREPHPSPKLRSPNRLVRTG